MPNDEFKYLLLGINNKVKLCTCCLLLLSKDNPSLSDVNWLSRSAGMVFFKYYLQRMSKSNVKIILKKEHYLEFICTLITIKGLHFSQPV